MIDLLKEKLIKILFKVQGYDLDDVQEYEDKIVIIAHKKGILVCPNCSTESTVYDSKAQEILIGTLFRRSIYLRTRVYRTDCVNCGVLTVPNGITNGKRRYSNVLGKEVIQFTKHLNNQQVADLLGLSLTTVYNIDFKELDDLKDKYVENIPDFKQLTVDEVSYKRRHNYATVVSNYDSGKVLWLEKNRKTKDLENAYDVLKSGLSAVTCVSMDLWGPYHTATNNKIPKASIIYDRFHLSRMLNRAVEEERRDYQNYLDPDARKTIKKKTRWVLLRRQANGKRDHNKHLKNLKKLNTPLYEIYLLKEDFLNIFDAKPTSNKARKEIISWVKNIEKTSYIHLKRFAKSIIKRIWDILNYFDNPISNAKAEGINNVIKSVLKRSYGYKNFDYFRLKILQVCGYLMDYTTHTF